MKKLSSIFFFLIIFTLVSKAQETSKGYYNTFWDKTYSLNAGLKNDKIVNVYIQVQAQNSQSAYIIVDFDDLESFKTSLELLRDKYISWTKIAEENNITEMEKEFDITFPRVNITWGTSQWFHSFSKKITMNFYILEDGRKIAKWTPQVTSYSNKYIKEILYFIFSCEEDFNNLISKLNSHNIIDKISERKNNEELFQ